MQHPFDSTHGQDGVPGYALSQALNLSIEFVMRNNLGDQPVLLCLFGIYGLPGEKQVAEPTTSQCSSASAQRYDMDSAYLYPLKPELCPIRGYSDIADNSDFAAISESIAVDSGDDGLGDILDAAKHPGI